MPDEAFHLTHPESNESRDALATAAELVDKKRDDNNQDKNEKQQRKSSANEVASARETLESLHGDETTPENERRVREARQKIGATGSSKEKEESEKEKGKDKIKNKQVEGGQLNLDDVEARIVEFENHQLAERHEAVTSHLGTRVIPQLITFGVRTISDLQIKLGCESENDLVKTCVNLLKEAGPATSEGFETSDILKSIGNLNALEEILITAFRLHKEDRDFRLSMLRTEPDSAIKEIKAYRKIQAMSDSEERFGRAA